MNKNASCGASRTLVLVVLCLCAAMVFGVLLSRKGAKHKAAQESAFQSDSKIDKSARSARPAPLLQDNAPSRPDQAPPPVDGMPDAKTVVEDPLTKSPAPKIYTGNRVIHGWGQRIVKFRKYGRNYMKTVGQTPVIVSSYIPLGSVRKNSVGTEQISEINKAFQDMEGKSALFLPLICITNHVPPQQESDATKMIQELVKTDKRLAAAKGMKPGEVIRTESLWHVVRDILKENGYHFGDLAVLEGKYDKELRIIAGSIKKTKSRVLLRFMQEFISGAHFSSVYGPETFRKAWIHLVNLMREEGVTNAEFVFHGNTGDWTKLEKFYPGGDYVDWIAGSCFKPKDVERCRKECQFAVSKKKPYMIAESSPALGPCLDIGTKSDEQWEHWFAPFFELIRSEKNLKLFVYINLDWGTTGKFSHWPDCRLEINDYISKQYKQEMTNPIYIHNQEFYSALPADTSKIPILEQLAIICNQPQ